MGLTWSPPVSNGGSPVTGYRVTRDGQDSTGGGAYSTVLPATARDFRFTLLNASAGYTFSVQAVTAVGTGPAARASSPAAPVVTLPGQPTSLVGTRSTDRTAVSLAWSPPISDGGSTVTGYRVTRDGQDSTGGGAYSTVLPATARAFRFTLLNPSAGYTFSVQAVTAVGTGPAARTSSPSR